MYNHRRIERKWQKIWITNKTFKTPKERRRGRRYILDMFPYPSGAGLHVGHPEGYTATDIYARYLRMNNYSVLHPMGWDAFGLPAENYAIKEGIHPKKSTKDNINNFRRQIKSLGLSYDWDREFSTADPDYYKWTQWLFLELYKHGLAYRKKAPVNWCSSCQTVLAREQVIDEKCHRCQTKVLQKNLKQWFFKITAFAEELLNCLPDLDWSDSLKLMQINWIGKSQGARIKFFVENETLEVFTTRPDTIFGATYIVLAPEHPLVEKLILKIAKNKEQIKLYRKKTEQKTNLQRTDLNKEKTGVLVKGIRGVNPINQSSIPLVIADYVLASYGTGAIMAVPAHDDRDFEFAKKFNLPIKQVIVASKAKKEKVLKETFTKFGVLINSGKYSGLKSKLAGKKIIQDLANKGLAEFGVEYKLRDWLISRQRYWGTPIPIIYCNKCGTVPVPEKLLPIHLPENVDFKPRGKSPLAFISDFVKTNCPNCQSKARRETDTMDTFVDSSWYMFRFTDPHNKRKFADKAKLKRWMPVDMYVGGAEHAVLHLLYARFITKALASFGYLGFNEPFKRLRNQGLILASDGKKMSKSLGNVINPDEIVRDYGADSLRLYEMFMGPLQDAKPWNTNGIQGVRRFLDKVYRDSKKVSADIKSDKLRKNVSKLAINIGNAITSFKFNTAISDLMKFRNNLDSSKLIPKKIWESFLICLSPFAPHICEELWSKLGNKSLIATAKWDKAILTNQLINKKCNLPVQINGKLKVVLTLSRSSGQNDAKTKALKHPLIRNALGKKTIKRVIYRKGKILNFVV